MTGHKEGSGMLTLIAIIALTSVPYVLDLYFHSSSDPGPTGEEKNE
jgi:hypothetical protein